jgi:hypothetical protein
MMSIGVVQKQLPSFGRKTSAQSANLFSDKAIVGCVSLNQKEIEKMNAFFRFIASPAGRVVRIVAGLALILIGLLALDGLVGWIVAIVGLVPLAAGVFDWCVFAPLFGLPFVGARLRQALQNTGQ